jgi:bacterioferritin-associated ferredoxin
VLVCHCLRVFDNAVRECVRTGARSAADVGARCGAGTRCGGCRPSIESIVIATAGAVEADRDARAAECPRPSAPLRIAA